jgi:hypothetical protein
MEMKTAEQSTTRPVPPLARPASSPIWSGSEPMFGVWGLNPLPATPILPALTAS